MGKQPLFRLQALSGSASLFSRLVEIERSYAGISDITKRAPSLGPVHSEMNENKVSSPLDVCRIANRNLSHMRPTVLIEVEAYSHKHKLSRANSLDEFTTRKPGGVIRSLIQQLLTCST